MKRDPKTLALLVLVPAVLALGAIVARDHLPAVAKALRTGVPAGGESVSVIEVVPDRSGREFVDVLFDRPLGEGRIGDVLGEEPARLEPKTGGSWRWQGANVLRFEPSGRLAIATDYRMTLRPEVLLKPSQRFRGGVALTFRTDHFRVEAVQIFEEPAVEGKGLVVLRGEARFNFPVDPKVLATKLQVIDPDRGAGAPVAITFETDYASHVVGFRTEPLAKRKSERELRVVVKGDLTCVEGNVTLPADFTQVIPLGSKETLTVRGISVQPGAEQTSIRIEFSSVVEASVVARYLKIAPAVETNVAMERNTLVLNGAFRPGQRYALDIGAGLPATDDSTLAEAYHESLDIADLDPSVDFQSNGMFLSASGWRTVAVESVNVADARLTVDRVFLNNLFFLFQYHGWQVWQERAWTWGDEEGDDADEADGEGSSTSVPRALGERVARVTLRLGGERNRKVTTPLRLDDWVKGRPGLYRVAVHRRGINQEAQRWLLVTDLGIVAKIGRGEAAVWVASVADLGPIAGADVRILSDKNQTIARGRTDAGGFWRARDLETEFGKQRPYMVVVEKGSDLSFLVLDHSRIDTSGLDVAGAASGGAAYDAYLYGERDLYRPGEKVLGLAVVRDRALAPPPPMPLVLRHRDPTGRELATQTLTLDRRGLAPFALDVLPAERTGPHALELLAGDDVIGRYRFLVEEFVPDRIRVEITTDGNDVLSGHEAAIEVGGRYLFGPPASGLPAETRVRLVAAPFVPAGYDAYAFSNGQRRFEDREIVARQDVLDPDGKLTLSAAIPAGLRPPASIEAEIVARVQEEGGRGVTAVRRVRVHAYPYYLGVRRLGEGYPSPHDTVAFEWVAVTPAGAKAQAGPLRVELFRDRWNTVLRQTPQGTWRWDTTRIPEPVDNRAVSGGGATGTFSFKPPQHGTYRAVVTDTATGASSETEFDVSGWGYSPWAIRSPDRLQVTLDKDEYAAGETATVQVKSPFPGKLLLAVERDRVFTTEVHALTGNTAKLALTVGDDWRPNAYVTALVVRSAKDIEPGGAGRAFGAAPIRVDRTPNRLAVEVTGPEEVRPGTKLTVAVRAAGRATVTVAAVDEGILQLISQKTPDPFEFFYRKAALEVTAHDLFSLLFPDVNPGEGRASAGGDAALLRMNRLVSTESIRRVRPVAFWSGAVDTDPAGRAAVSFDVPEFQGALRIMAVAHTGRKFGQAERMVRVRDPIVVLPTFPRFLAFDDVARIPVGVRNDSGRDDRVRVTLAVEGPVRVDGDSAGVVQVPNGQSRTVSFVLKSEGRPGVAKLSVRGEGRATTTVATSELPVRSDLPARSDARSGAIEQAATSIPADPSGFRPESVTRDLRLASFPLLQMSAKLRRLVDYPYGCVEQTASAAFPLLYFGDMAKALDPVLFERTDPAVRVREAIRALATMQLAGGAFAMWPNGETSWPWGTVYATHFLVEARRAGYPVESFLYDRALRAVAAEAKAKRDYATEERQRVAYALYVLARAGKADVGTMDFLRDRHRKDLGAEGKALLGAAYAALGDPRPLDELLRGVEDVDEARRQTGGNLNSTVRNRAILLLAFLDAAPDDPRIPKLVDRLARDARADGYWSTQETALAFAALGQYFRRQAALGPYAGTVLVAGTPVGRFTSDAPALFRDLPAGPVAVRMEAGYRAGAASYVLDVRGVPTDAAFQPAKDGLEIERELLNRDGTPIEPSGVVQGELVVMRTRVRSVSGPVQNVAVTNLLPAGLEVENPRLTSSETLTWVSDAAGDPAHLDARDDRVVLFTDLPQAGWVTTYALLRATTPGSFRLPPPQAEAMYDPSLRAIGVRGTLEVKGRP